ncbi:MAG: thermonuclease family protein [Betaproteobacteria bacterium]|nr:thermonuclease family protein [Betaproteobacteria bacterium]
MSSAEVPGRVVSVHDGDTLTVLTEQRGSLRIRLKDIDAPELSQPFGRRSRQSLSELCSGKPVELDVRGTDRYRRAIARVTCSGTDANAEQVRRGYAWTFTRYAGTESPLHAIQAEARAARRGLWGDPSPQPPWDWRRKSRPHRATRPAAPADSGPDPAFRLTSGDVSHSPR